MERAAAGRCVYGGLAMMTNLVDCDFEALRIGQTVRVVFEPTDGGLPVPMFRPG